MSTVDVGYFITGLTNSGQKFRPSDWVERVATVCASFDQSCRLQYNPMMKPIYYDGMKGLFVDIRLQSLNPYAYDYVMDFSLSNHLQVLNIGQLDSMANVA